MVFQQEPRATDSLARAGDGDQSCFQSLGRGELETNLTRSKPRLQPTTPKLPLVVHWRRQTVQSPSANSVVAYGIGKASR
jgi:hypothetical protein